ncbi:MAG TPA: cation-transporting P-type ATPase, partial [Amnibacterium sp.]|uniref:cation-translocating P-type ATPase n=1 Tax=Amnibacterium sp. TaxID=1872496 RepID=UPI002F9202AD
MSTTGLTVAEAGRRLAAGGRNEVVHPRRMSMWSTLLMQLRDPLILVLLGACVLTVLTGDLTDAAVIAIVIAANSVVGGVQEIRADRAITALAQLSAPSVRVRRGGEDVSVPSSEVVPGDVVLLAEGDIVPADGELLEASSLLLDESALTGESVPVARGGPDGEAGPEQVSAGTVVVRGRAVMSVTRTGGDSALGRISALLDTRPHATPLQRRLAGLGRVLAAVAVGLSIVVLAAGLVRGEPLELMVVTAVSLAVAAVPESLPAVVTLALALGARRMADRSAIVRRLPAVETLGSVTVLATDKTGTLTHARMVVSELWTPQRTVRLDGDGYEPRGAVTSGGAPLQPGSVPDVMDLLQACALCNDASLHPPEVPGERWKGIGDPTEVALLAAAGKLGMSRDGLERDHHRVREVPFDSRSQAMTTVHAVPGDGDALLVVQKGSPEAVLARMPEPSDQAAGRAVLEVAGDYAARGFRVLAVASGLIPAGAPIGSARLRLLGLVAIDDPAKSDALATVRACRAAGITPVLITGDHPATARAVARSVGILDGVEGTPEPVVTGQQIADGSA